MGCRVALGDVCSFYRGASVPRTRMYDKGAYLYIHYGDLYKGFDLHIDVEDPAKPIPYILNNEKIKDSQRLRDQDIVYVLTSETVDDLGHAYLFNNPKEKPTISGTETTIVRVNRRDLVVPAYLNYLMSSPRFIRELRQYTRGMKVFRVHPKDVARIEIDLPQTEVQHQIVSILDAIYAKQQANSKLNGYLEELLLAQFTALSPNENWTEGRADSYYEIGIGKTPPRKEPEWFSDVKADNHVWLSIKDMGETGTYSLDSSEYLTDAAVNAKNVRRVPAGSVLLSFKLTVGRVKIAGCNMTTNEAIACFASDDKRKLAYAYPYLRSFDYGKLGSTSSIATAVNSKTVKAMPFAMPGDLELSEFYLSTKPIYEQLLATAKESRFLAQLRDVLLPKLMSGEIDVSKVDLTQLNSHLA